MRIPPWQRRTEPPVWRLNRASISSNMLLSSHCAFPCTAVCWSLAITILQYVTRLHWPFHADKIHVVSVFSVKINRLWYCTHELWGIWLRNAIRSLRRRPLRAWRWYHAEQYFPTIFIWLLLAAIWPSGWARTSGVGTRRHIWCYCGLHVPSNIEVFRYGDDTTDVHITLWDSEGLLIPYNNDPSVYSPQDESRKVMTFIF